MNLRLVNLALGGILSLVCLLMIVCLLFSMGYEGAEDSPWPSVWWISLLPTLGAAAIFLVLGRKADRQRIFRREAFAVVGLGWCSASLFCALPFVFAPLDIPVWDALFESVSGLTTTGSTIFPDLGLLPQSLLLWRSLMQWMGGLGIIILFVAILGFFGIGNKALFHRESSALADSEMGTRFQMLSLRYLIIYVSITLAGIVGLWVLGMEPMAAIHHGLCAIATGGFSPHNESVAFYPQLSLHLWLVVLMMAGGVAFPLHFLIWYQRRYRVLWSNEEFRTYLLIMLGVSVVIGLDLVFYGGDLPSKGWRLVVDALFQTVSIMTTTGFTSTNYDQWPPLTKFLMLGLMFMGGCAGSTAGGIKVSRFIVFTKAALRHLRTVYCPHRIETIRLNTKVLSGDSVHGVIIYFALYFILLLVGILGLALLEPTLQFATILSAVITCFNNVGPGLAEVGPNSNFASLQPMGKLWLSAFMLLGRLELYAILLLLLPSFWKKF